MWGTLWNWEQNMPVDGADELVYLDITATHEGRKLFADLVRRIAEHLNIPFTVGGGINQVDDAEVLLSAGADKVSINSSAVRDPGLIDRIAGGFGNQFVVVAIDAQLKDRPVDRLCERWQDPHRKGAVQLGQGGPGTGCR